MVVFSFSLTVHLRVNLECGDLQGTKLHLTMASGSQTMFLDTYGKLRSFMPLCSEKWPRTNFS